MSRLLGPREVAETFRRLLERSWPERVCARAQGQTEAMIARRLRPGTATQADVQRLGHAVWTAWRMAWRDVDLGGLAGVGCERDVITIQGVTVDAPREIRVATLAAGQELLARLGAPLEVDVDRAQLIAERLLGAGAVLAPRALKQVYRLDHGDVEAVLSAIVWLGAHPDLSGQTLRQLPIPRVHTKWLARHEALVRELTGRTISAETLLRPAVVHFTYLDPTYRTAGGRRHDAWTTGDSHEPAYRPRIVLVVENRDCRLHFPAVPGAIAVEGAGKAAAASLAGIDWLRSADRVLYWGDIDADGYVILASLRKALADCGLGLTSILMDDRAMSSYAELGVSQGKDGKPLGPSGVRVRGLAPGESAAYQRIASLADPGFRRIEQERLPLGAALDALQKAIAGPA